MSWSWGFDMLDWDRGFDLIIQASQTGPVLYIYYLIMYKLKNHSYLALSTLKLYICHVVWSQRNNVALGATFQGV